jgi:hypothetical protein
MDAGAFKDFTGVMLFLIFCGLEYHLKICSKEVVLKLDVRVRCIVPLVDNLAI